MYLRRDNNILSYFNSQRKGREIEEGYHWGGGGGDIS